MRLRLFGRAPYDAEEEWEPTRGELDITELESPNLPTADTAIRGRYNGYWCDALGYPVGAHAEVVLTVKATVSHRDGDYLVLTTEDGEHVRVLPGVVRVLTSRRWCARAGRK